MKIPILFLDFDGVLNSIEWLKRRPSKTEWSARRGISEEEFASQRLDWALRSIDPDAVDALNEIIKRTNARVIVSSTWRTMWSLDKLERLLRWAGFEYRLLGATPDGSAMRESGIFEANQRGHQIESWLVTMFGADYVEHCDFVIIDDDCDMGALAHRHFCTSPDDGLTMEHVDAVVAMFQRTP